MGLLTIISVKGAVPHSACHFEYEDMVYKNGWLGFGPAAHRRPAGKGKVFTDDEGHRLNHKITFQIRDEVMYNAGRSVAESYTGDFYVLGVHDCVSFSAEVARQCGLGVPDINFTPYGLILILAAWNDYEEIS